MLREKTLFRNKKGAGTMGDILAIIALALYVPMSMVYVLSEKG